MFPAVFIDRDGVICEEKSYITSVDQLNIYGFAVDALKLLREASWKTIMVTNQSAVARGLMSECELKVINDRLMEVLAIDKIYYCPHYPPKGEAILPYNINCNCRKPEPGMILRASIENNINLNKSFMVGDRASDILAGKNAGLKTVMVKTGYGSKGLEFEVRPDFIFSNIKEFVEYLLGYK